MQQGERNNEGKLEWSQVDFKALEPMVRVLMKGGKAHGKDNWRKGFPTLEICESLLRHTFAYMSGEDNDLESGESHIGHMLSNLMFLSYTHENRPDLDNRFKKPEPQGGVLKGIGPEELIEKMSTSILNKKTY